MRVIHVRIATTVQAIANNLAAIIIPSMWVTYLAIDCSSYLSIYFNLPHESNRHVESEEFCNINGSPEMTIKRIVDQIECFIVPNITIL